MEYWLDDQLQFLSIPLDIKKGKQGNNITTGTIHWQLKSYQITTFKTRGSFQVSQKRNDLLAALC